MKMRFAQKYFSLVICFFMVFPLIAIIPISFSSNSFLSYPMPGFSLQWYAKVFRYEPWMKALMNSLIVGSGATVMATVLGIPAALGFAKSKLFAQRFLLGFVISPMIIPLVVSGISMYFFLAKLNLIGTFLGMIIAHTVLAVPFVVIPVMAALQNFDTDLISAAESLGANPMKAFFKVTLPGIAPGIISGALFAFATSFDELVVALFIAGPEQKTLPRVMFDGLKDNIEPSILAMSSILILVALAIVFFTRILSLKKK